MVRRIQAAPGAVHVREKQSWRTLGSDPALTLALCSHNPEEFCLRPKALPPSSQCPVFSGSCKQTIVLRRDHILLSTDDGYKVKLKFDKLYQKSPFPKNFLSRSLFLIWSMCSCWVLAYCKAFCKIKFIEHSPILKKNELISLPWWRSSPVWLTWAPWRQSYISTDTAHNHFITWLEVTRTILYGPWHRLCFRSWNLLNILARSWNIQAGISLPNQISLFAIRSGPGSLVSTRPPLPLCGPGPGRKIAVLGYTLSALCALSF